MQHQCLSHVTAIPWITIGSIVSRRSAVPLDRTTALRRVSVAEMAASTHPREDRRPDQMGRLVAIARPITTGILVRRRARRDSGLFDAVPRAAASRASPLSHLPALAALRHQTWPAGGRAWTRTRSSRSPGV